MKFGLPSGRIGWHPGRLSLRRNPEGEVLFPLCAAKLKLYASAASAGEGIEPGFQVGGGKETADPSASLGMTCGLIRGRAFPCLKSETWGTHFRADWKCAREAGPSVSLGMTVLWEHAMVCSNGRARRYTMARSLIARYWFSTEDVTASGLRSRVSAPCSWRRASNSSRRLAIS